MEHFNIEQLNRLNNMSVAVRHKGDEVQRRYGHSADKACRRKDEQAYLESMSVEQLRQTSLEKALNGCATELAIKAQRMIYERLHNWW